MDDENQTSEPISTEELKQLRAKFSKASELIEKVTALQTQYESAEAGLKNSVGNVEKLSADARGYLASIENAKNNSTTHITAIKGDLERAESVLASIENGLNEFATLQGEVKGKSGEISTLLTAATSLHNDIDTLKKAAQQRLLSIEDLLAQVQSKIDQMQKAYEGFLVVYGKISDEKTGLEAILANSTNLQKKSGALFIEIQSFRDESLKYLEEIKANKTISDTLRIEIQDNLEIAKSRRDEVEKITNLITDTGFANAFQQRERMLRVTAVVWLAVFVLSVIGLSFVLLYVFNGLDSVPELRVLIYRLTLTSPLLLLIGFSIRQYGIERRLNEKYAFKAARAVVMREHTNFLIEEIKRTDVPTGQFIRESMASLYSEPFEGYSPQRNSSSQNDVQEKSEGLDIDDIITKAKELKEIVPDNETLKSIVNLFSKFK
ncbi:hypothetical protein K2Q16_02110 [Patescibacteria group bacterium]|nr:hypothetical protein [Patescibacteria group bacterium]